MEFDYIKVKELIDNKWILTVTPSLKLQSDDIKSSGITAVVSQDQEFLVGYTDFIDKKLTNAPYIVFGDHTEIFKFISFPFAQGADGIKILKVNEDYLNPVYTFYALKNCYYPTGFYQRHFKLLRKTYIPNFSLDYQKKLASILNNYDQLIENNNKRIQILEDMAESLYKEWFVRFRFPGYENIEFENGIPKGWEIQKIKNCVKRRKFGVTYKEFELESEGEVVVIDQSASFVLGYHSNQPSHTANYINPILLFGDHTCKYQLMNCDFSLGENVIPYTSIDSKKINDYYLFYATKGILKTEEYKRHWGKFVSFKIFVPDYQLQLKYASIVEKNKRLIDQLYSQNQKLVKQRDSLLPRLMSGKLSVEGKEVI